MSTNRKPDPLDPAIAERLLRGEPVDGHDGLAQLLAAAAAPARPGELSGEAAALHAFRQVRLTTVPSRRRPSMLKSALAKFLTVKAAAIVLATSGVGGVALAAGTGNLPEPVQRHLPGASASASHRAHPSHDPSWARNSQSAHPLGQLCRRYAERDRDHRGTALKNDPEFRDLVKNAGTDDQEKVDRFCADLRGDRPSGAPSERPSGRPTRPSGQPSDRPGGMQSERPGNMPTDRPSASAPR